MTSLQKLFLVVTLTIILAFLNALVVFYLWNWIIFKIFPASWLSMSQAFGITIIISYLKSRREVAKPEDGDDSLDVFLKMCSWSFVNSFLFLILGWIISHYL